MKRVLVTGATGFVGRELCGTLSRAGWTVRAALRRDGDVPGGVVEKMIVGEIGHATNWHAALAGVESVVHSAARAHVLHDRNNFELYNEVNARGTRCLAEAAAAAGIRRFVYLSSIKVNGESTAERSFTSSDKPHPHGEYAESKWLAEKALHEIESDSGMDIAIVRPPLIYGPSVRANFQRLLLAVSKGRPLPLGRVNNRRSLVSIWNLCDFLAHVLSHPRSASGVWLVSDGEDLSTPELIRRMGRELGVPAFLLPVPVAMLRGFGALIGKADEVKRLCGSLEVDIAPTCQHFDWQPPVTVDESIKRTVQWFSQPDRGAAS